MKKFLLILSLALFLGNTGISFAKCDPSSTVPCSEFGINTLSEKKYEGTIDKNISRDGLGQSVLKIINYFLTILGILGVLMIVYAGFKMVISQGEGEEFEKSRMIIIYVLIGFVIVFLSFSIIKWISKVGSEGQSPENTYEDGGEQKDFPTEFDRNVNGEKSDYVLLNSNGDLVGKYEKGVKYIKAIIKASPNFGRAPLIVTFDGLNSLNPTGKTILSKNYTWYYDDMNGKKIIIGQGPYQKYKFEKEGIYRVYLEIKSENPKEIKHGITFRKIVIKPERTKVKLKINGKKVASTVRINIAKVKQSGVIFDISESIIEDSKEISEVKWNFGNGVLESFNSLQPITQIYDKAGKYKTIIEIIDNHGKSVKKIFDLFIVPLTAEIDILPKEGFISQKFILSGKNSQSSNGKINKYNISIIGPNGNILKEGNEREIFFTPTKAGKYKTSITIQNSNGKKDSKIKEFYVNSNKPVAVFVHRKKKSSGVYYFDAGASYDVDNEKIKYSWDFNGDGVYEILNGDSKASYIFDSIGLQNIKLKVTDSFGNSDIYKKIINISDISETDFFIQNPASEVGQNIKITPVLKNIKSLVWNFGDGNTENISDTSDISNNSINYSYKKKGIYHITLKTINTLGEEKNLTRKVYIGDGKYPIGFFGVKINNEESFEEQGICGKGKNGYRIYKTDLIQLDGGKSINASSLKGNLSYSWDFGDGEIGQGVSIKHKFKSLKDDCFKISLKIKDEKTQKTSDLSNNVWFKVVNKKPISGKLFHILKENEVYKTPLRVKLSLPNLQDKDGEIKRITWYYKTESSNEKLGMIKTKLPETLITVNPNGLKGLKNTYFFNAEIEDNDGGITNLEKVYGAGKGIQFINSQASNLKLSIKASKTQIKIGDSVTFSGNADNGEDEVFEYKWDFDGDGIFEEKTNKNIIKKVFNKKGAFEIALRVEDKGIIKTVFKKIFVDSKNKKNKISTKEKIKIKEEKNKILKSTFDNLKDENFKGKTFKSIRLKGEKAPLTSIYLEVEEISKNIFGISAFVDQSDGTIFKGEVEFLIIEGKGKIKKQNIISKIGKVENILEKTGTGKIKVKATAIGTIYGDISEELYLR